MMLRVVYIQFIWAPVLAAVLGLNLRSAPVQPPAKSSITFSSKERITDNFHTYEIDPSVPWKRKIETGRGYIEMRCAPFLGEGYRQFMPLVCIWDDAAI